MCDCGKHRYEIGARVQYDDNKGTVTRRVFGTGGPVAYYVRWDNGYVGTAWATDLLPEGDTDDD